MTGTTSRTARAWPRGLVWRKRNANFRSEEHEAHMRQRNLGEQAKKCEAQCHSEGSFVDATGLWKESRCAILGEICPLVRKDRFCCEAER